MFSFRGKSISLRCYTFPDLDPNQNSLIMCGVNKKTRVACTGCKWYIHRAVQEWEISVQMVKVVEAR